MDIFCNIFYDCGVAYIWEIQILEEQKLLTLPEHLSSPPVFNGVRLFRSLVFCVVFCRSLFAL
jgi:hypothetical protein